MRSDGVGWLPMILAACAACDGGAGRPGYLSDDAAVADNGALVTVRGDARSVRPMSSCGGMSTSLAQRRVTAMLVIDRSGSMADATDDGYQKWASMVSALREVLPRVDDAIDLGLVVFPRVGDTTGTLAASCAVGGATDLSPRRHQAATVLSVLDATSPGGSTPTYAGLDVAARRLLEAPDRTGELALILATDGAPNCNAALDRATCRCTSAVGRCADASVDVGSVNCLDDDRTVRAIASLRATQGVSTYVIGLNGAEGFADVLDAMALAGGHPRAEAPRYFSASTADELVREFQRVTTGLVDCRWRLDQTPPDPALVDVRLDGRSVFYDVSHRDGWDWTDGTHQEIRFYGTACVEVQNASGGSRLAAAFGCPAPTPP